MQNNFGSYLKQFAFSVDLVNKALSDEVFRLLDEYFKKNLLFPFYELLLESRVNDGEGLRAERSSYTRDIGDSVSVFKENKEYNGQTAFAFHEAQCPMWIRNKSDAYLSDPNAVYIDHWSGIPDIPRYWPYKKNPYKTKTSIILPLKNSKSHVFWVLNLESTRSLKISDTMKTELTEICGAISIIEELYQAAKFREDNTIEALTRLKNTANHFQHNQDNNPSFFLATPSRCDESVVGIIREVLTEELPEVQEIYWKDIEESGNINSKILEAISKSMFGICYFSEVIPDASGKVKYSDNPNVLFEAGMLHALVNNPLGAPSAWIPIRENDEYHDRTIPFDFASERIVKVPRINNNSVNSEKFIADLKKRLKEFKTKLQK